MSTLEPISNPFGSLLKALLKARKLRAFELADLIGVSATSISKIMNGVSRPRQNTFTKLCQVLCKTNEEEHALVQAFLSSEQLSEDSAPPILSNSEEETLRLRSKQFLERKTEAILFKRRVARELDQAEISYQQDYCDAPYSTDFLIDHKGDRIALECKSNPERDIEKTHMTLELLSSALELHSALIVTSSSAYTDENSVDLENLISHLNNL